jgi:hypothetical protein
VSAFEINLPNLFNPDRWSGSSALTLEERLVAMGVDSVLPRRHAQNLAPLAGLLDHLIFTEKQLRKPENPANDGLDGSRVLLTSERLAQALGADYEKAYSPRDWSAAMEMVLDRHNDPVTPIRFGDDYRVNFNFDGAGGVMVIVCNEELLPRSVR